METPRLCPTPAPVTVAERAALLNLLGPQQSLLDLTPQPEARLPLVIDAPVAKVSWSAPGEASAARRR